MAETREVHDPFAGKTVSINNDLVRRLRGEYAVGPTLPNGEPEFGWRKMGEPSAEIERMCAAGQEPNWNYMARAMQRGPFFAQGDEEDIETALKIASDIPTRCDGCGAAVDQQADACASCG